MRPRSPLRRPVLFVLALVLAVLLFLGGADLVATRSFKHLWDLGHVVAFAVWSLLLLDHPRLARMKWSRQLLASISFAFLVGGAVELVQGVFGRYPSWADLGRDVIGGLLAMSFLAPARLVIPHLQRTLVQSVTLLLLVITLMPLTRALADEWSAWRTFPMLGDFEAPFELDRWSGDASLSIVQSHFATGLSALRIDLNTTRYSGAVLTYFPGDWRGWNWIAFSVFNPDAQPIRLVCKINDQYHDVSGYRYADRFNRRLEIDPGWHRVRIALDDVRQAPADRNMDLSQVTEFNLFAVSLPRPRTIYVDALTLEP